jgi:hypothetical protein
MRKTIYIVQLESGQLGLMYGNTLYLLDWSTRLTDITRGAIKNTIFP